MIGRGWFAMFLVGAAVMPYLMSSQSPLRNMITSVDAGHSTTVGPSGPAAASTPAMQPGFANSGTAAAPPAGGRPAPRGTSTAGESLVSMSEAFRWEVSPAWIMSRWPRVSTHLAELDLQGYRVPLVTGTSPTDIAGSLTYYFDAKQQLQRITFYGTTGDAHDLVVLLQQQHRFQCRLTEDPSLYLYQVEQDRQALSELKIRAAPVVKAGQPLSRFDVALEMRRPE